MFQVRYHKMLASLFPNTHRKLNTILTFLDGIESDFRALKEIQSNNKRKNKLRKLLTVRGNNELRNGSEEKMRNLRTRLMEYLRSLDMNELRNSSKAQFEKLKRKLRNILQFLDDTSDDRVLENEIRRILELQDADGTVDERNPGRFIMTYTHFHIDVQVPAFIEKIMHFFEGCWRAIWD